MVVIVFSGAGFGSDLSNRAGTGMRLHGDRSAHANHGIFAYVAAWRQFRSGSAGADCLQLGPVELPGTQQLGS
jgi:hypothetical protein